MPIRNPGSVKSLASCVVFFSRNSCVAFWQFFAKALLPGHEIILCKSERFNGYIRTQRPYQPYPGYLFPVHFRKNVYQKIYPKLITFFANYIFLRYTEIWSDDGGSKTIKLVDPKLNGYYNYPELVLVDTQFCVKP